MRVQNFTIQLPPIQKEEISVGNVKNAEYVMSHGLLCRQTVMPSSGLTLAGP